MQVWQSNPPPPGPSPRDFCFPSVGSNQVVDQKSWNEKERQRKISNQKGGLKVHDKIISMKGLSTVSKLSM